MNLEVSAEHSPMSGIDEYLIHNYPHPVRVMWTSDPRAYERLWFTAQDKVGEVFFVCGLGFYPNLGTAEAYALVNHNGVHTSVHAHRKMGDDRTNMKIGPFEFEIVEPFKQWHISLADNEFGFSYDMQWYDSKRAVFQQLGAGMIHNGRVGGNTAGYETFGEQQTFCLHRWAPTFAAQTCNGVRRSASATRARTAFSCTSPASNPAARSNHLKAATSLGAPSRPSA